MASMLARSGDALMSANKIHEPTGNDPTQGKYCL